MENPNKHEVFKIKYLEKIITIELSNVLNVIPDQIDKNIPFKEMGFESLMAKTMVIKLRKILSIEISPIIFWSFPTVIALAKEIFRMNTTILDQSHSEIEIESNDLPEDLSLLSDDEIAELLLKELGKTLK